MVSIQLFQIDVSFHNKPYDGNKKSRMLLSEMQKKNQKKKHKIDQDNTVWLFES